MRPLFKSYREIIAAISLAAALFAFVNSTHFDLLRLAFNFWDPVAITHFRLNQLSTDEFNAEIEKSLKAGDIDDAQQLVRLAVQFGHVLPEELIERTQESTLVTGIRNSVDFTKGAVTGEFDSPISLSGVVATDFFVVGDIRDVIIQGKRILVGQDYDEITLSLALLGVATTIPAAAPMDLGVSLLKTANKANKLSKPLRRQLVRIANEMIDAKALREVLSRLSLPKISASSPSMLADAIRDADWAQIGTGNFSSIRAMASDAISVDYQFAKDALRRTIRPAATKQVTEFVNSAESIASNGGLASTFSAFEQAENITELNRFAILSKGVGKSTASAIKLLGRSAIKLGELVYFLIALLIATASWCVGTIWTLRSTLKVFRGNSFSGGSPNA